MAAERVQVGRLRLVKRPQVEEEEVFYLVAGAEHACSAQDITWEDRFCLPSCLSQTAVQIVPSWSLPGGICSRFRWHVTCALMQLSRDESWLFCRGRFRALAVAGQSLGMFTRPDGGMTLARGRVTQLLRVLDGKLGFEVGSALNNREIWKDQNADPTLKKMRSSSGAKACVLV